MWNPLKTKNFTGIGEWNIHSIMHNKDDTMDNMDYFYVCAKQVGKAAVETIEAIRTSGWGHL